MLIYDRPRLILDLTSEKLIKSSELIDVFDFYLIEVDSIELSKTEIHILPQVRRQWRIRQEAGELARSS